MLLHPILASGARSGVSTSLDANPGHYCGFSSDHVAAPGPEGNTVEQKGPSDGKPVPPHAP